MVRCEWGAEETGKGGRSGGEVAGEVWEFEGLFSSCSAGLHLGIGESKAYQSPPTNLDSYEPPQSLLEYRLAHQSNEAREVRCIPGGKVVELQTLPSREDCESERGEGEGEVGEELGECTGADEG